MKMRLYYVLVLILLVASLAMAQRMAIKLDVTNGTGAVSDTFGLAVNATNCIDAALGEYELPPKPPSGVFDVRFVETCSPAIQGLKIDYHEGSLTTAMTGFFKIEYQQGDPNQPVIFSWPSNLSNAFTSLRLKDPFGGGMVNVDMLANTTATIAADAGLPSLKIEYTGIIVVSGVHELKNGIPTEFTLNQNYPNPFNPTTSIDFAVQKASFTEVAVYNVLGQKVTTLVAEQLNPGFYTAKWNSTDDNGVAVSSGVYYVRMTATYDNGGNFSALRKVVLMK